MQRDSCPPGELPDLLEGCAPIGVAGCDVAFLVDGVCLPSRTLCGDGSFAVPTEGCVPIDGDAGCGVGTFGDLIEEVGDVHVDPASVIPGADGSRAAPYLTIEAALAAAGDGGRIVLAAGSYDEPVEIDRPLSIIGRCPSLVELSGETPHGVALVLTPTTAVRVVDVTGDVNISRVRLAGPGVGLIVEGSDVTVSGVEVESVGRGIVVASAGTVDVQHPWVHDVQTNPDGTRGDGLIALAASTATVRRSAFAGNATAGIASIALAAGRGGRHGGRHAAWHERFGDRSLR